MDKLIEQLLEDEVSCYGASVLRNQQSAFVPYSPQTPSTASAGNMNKRMIEFLRKSSRLPAVQQPDRCFRHMMNERQRREKQKTSYAALHSLLPAGTKSDKISVVQSAAQSIEELRRLKADLERRNRELEENLAQATKLKIRVPNPASGIDSFISVLKCLKSCGSETRAVQAEVADHEFLATMYVEITDKIGVAEVKNAVQRALHEADLKLPSPTPSGLITPG